MRIRNLLHRLVRYAMSQGWYRGVVDGNQVWAVIGGLALLAHLAGRVLERRPEVVFLEKLGPGEVLEIFEEPRS